MVDVATNGSNGHGRGGLGRGPLEGLEHDHVHLNELVFELRALLGSAASGDNPGDDAARAELVAHVELVREDLLHHFAREEEGLFPFVRERVPTLAAEVARIESAHDTICGALGRLEALVRRATEPLAASQALAQALFERFETGFAEHARLEGTLLQVLAERLQDAERAELAQLLDGL